MGRDELPMVLEAVSACGQVIAHQLEAAMKALRAAEILLKRVGELTVESEQVE